MIKKSEEEKIKLEEDTNEKELKGTEENKENENIEENKPIEDIVEFSFSAFVFTFMYFVVKGKWMKSLICLVFSILIPLRYYPIFGLIVGFFATDVTEKKSKINSGNFFLGCISLLVFCAGKYLRNRILGVI